MSDKIETDLLYQVRVIQGDKCLDVGPKMIKEAAEKFRDTIEAQIRLGKERLWKEPIIYPVYR